MLTLLARILKALNSETSARSLAIAVVLGMFLGLTPLWRVHNLIILLAALIFRVNLSLLGAAAIFGWTFVASLVIWYLLKVTVGIRVSEEQEYLGGDISECGVEAYPEFTGSTKR